MGKLFFVLLLSVAILGGGFYLFVNYYQDGELIVNDGNQGDIQNKIQDDSEIIVEPEIEWEVYNYIKNGLSFTTKIPKEKWEIIEQDLNAVSEEEEKTENINDEEGTTEDDVVDAVKEINLIFTNNDSCQLLYTFDLEASSYNFDLSNNADNDDCAKVLQKIIAYASVPKFGSDYNVADDSEDIIIEEDENKEENEGDGDILKQDQDDDEEVVVKKEDEEGEDILNQVQDNSDISSGTSDETLENMTADERYKSAKTFVHDYLTEYAKRHWDFVKKSLSKKALASLGDKNLSEVVTSYYYYELTTLITEVTEKQYKTTVKLTDKEENSISDGSGVYKLNIVWEDGGWKIDNYIFD